MSEAQAKCAHDGANGTYEHALYIRSLYNSGYIGREEAVERLSAYVEKFNATARDLAKKHGMKPKLFNFNAFMR